MKTKSKALKERNMIARGEAPVTQSPSTLTPSPAKPGERPPSARTEHSASSFTTGPWYVGEPIRGQDTIGICKEWRDGEELGEETIAEVLPGCSKEQMQSDARLIAAAPDLLRALQSTLDDAETNGCAGCAVISGEQLDTIRAAIAQARGEVPAAPANY